MVLVSLLVGTLGLLGYGIYYAWTEVDGILHCRKLPDRVTPAALGWEYESFTLEVGGLPVEGWFIPNRRDVTCILAPGYDGNRSAFLSEGFAHMLRALYGEGLALALFDPRGLGESGGELYALGAFEDEDIIAVMEYLKGEKGIEGFVLLGVSAGASAVIRAAAAHEPKWEIRCVIADSPFATPDWTRTYPRFWIEVFKLIARLRLGKRVVERLHVLDDAEDVRGILLMVGERDMTTPPLNALRLFQRAAAPKELWVVPGAGHSQAASLYPEEYDRHILRFIERCGLSP